MAVGWGKWSEFFICYVVKLLGQVWQARIHGTSIWGHAIWTQTVTWKVDPNAAFEQTLQIWNQTGILSPGFDIPIRRPEKGFSVVKSGLGTWTRAQDGTSIFNYKMHLRVKKIKKELPFFNVARPKVVGAQTTSSFVFFHFSFCLSWPNKKVLKKISFQVPKHQLQKSGGEGGGKFSCKDISYNLHYVIFRV